MEETKTPVEVLLDQVGIYAKTSLKLFRFKATDKVAGLFSDIVSGTVFGVILILIFVNLNIGIALLVGDLIGKMYWGFLSISGFYICLGLLIYLFRDRWIKQPVSNLIIRRLLDDEQTDEQKL